MKIIMIGQKGIPCIYGGVEQHVENLACGLAKLNQDVTVTVRSYYTPKKMTGFHGVRLLHLPTLHTKHLDAIFHTFLATLYTLFQDYDIIHYHGVGPALLAFLPRIFRPQFRVIVTFHCIDRKHAKWGFFARLILRLGEWAANHFAHQTISVSKALQFYNQETYDHDTTYIPNGVSQPRNSVDPKLITKFGLEPNKYFLAVGRLVAHKGIHYLIQAYQRLAVTDYKLVIVGDSVFTDSYVKFLKRLAQGNPRIIFLGFQQGKELQALFENAYLFVHPSESEGLPIVLLEAAIYQRAILASDIPENLEIISPIGFSFQKDNVEELYQKLKALIDQPEKVRQAGQLLYNKVRREYNWENIVRVTYQFYTTCLNHSLPPVKYSWQKI